MSSGELFLGIDTSCYTTSAAVIADGKALQLKKPLTVKEGECGLRQSDAFFQHIKNIPVLFDELEKQIDFKKYEKLTVTVSARPRSVEGSYMPVFLAGQSFARVIAKTHNAVYREVSHQDGHIMAAIYSCKKYSLLGEPFLTCHLSGGTTEILLTEQSADGFKCSIVGGTRDIPAGQFIDRIGVKMGMDFPCGKYLDYSAMEYGGELPKVKFCTKDGYINFSGEETRYSRLLEDGMDRETAAYSVMKCIADSVRGALEFTKEKYGVRSVLMVGGVSSSSFLREQFSDMPDIHFAEAALSTDNAVGVCELGRILGGGAERIVNNA